MRLIDWDDATMTAAVADLRLRLWLLQRQTVVMVGG